MRLPAHHFIRSRPHLSLAIALGAVAGLLLPSAWTLLTRLLGAWNVAVWAYLLTMMWMMARADYRKVRRIAAAQDENAAVILLTLCVAACMSLAAISSELAAVKDLPQGERPLHYAFAVLTLLGSWFLVGMLFCSHYAHLYYNAPTARRPLQFPDHDCQPNYWDFLYFSFTIAVAAQTSDVCVQSQSLRKLVLGQSVLSFFFNLVILGLSVNIAASMLNS
ncbi:DUF1345 domain-containing protein [Massilia sp. erpn]|uniref:DUF1345 domain-containing protein n=1 Tax=Massilia sp. erpn TaxID=2738142 RepID=UPI00210714A1|nr:DUF1345 domain-containing protein [Massilia sp. erpn]UTY56011.1 DUF1345 domain-containing protein [Massilia sp. erpn]